MNITSVPTTAGALAPDNPFWDDESQSLYLGDALSGLIYRFDYKENKVCTATADGLSIPTFLVPVRNSSTHFVASAGSSLVVVEWDGRSNRATVVDTVFSLPPDQLLNSCFVTPNGDMYIGTYGPTLCSAPKMPYYHYSADGGLVEITSDFRSTVGSFLLAKSKQMLQLDGCGMDLNVFNWDPDAGNLCKERL